MRGNVLELAMKVKQQKEKRDTLRCRELADDNIELITENILLKQENKRLNNQNEALIQRIDALERVDELEKIYRAVNALCR